MENNIKLDLENIDQIEFDDFFGTIQTQTATGENNIPLPDSKLAARKWVMAYLKMESEVEYLSKEYKEYLKNRYIKPIDDKIKSLEKSQDFIKDGLLKFFEGAEIESVSFPDFATVSKTEGRDKIIYPENEDSFAEEVLGSGHKDFVKTKYSLDKKEINKFYNENQKLPFNGLSVEKATDSVRVTKSKAFKELSN